MKRNFVEEKLKIAKVALRQHLRIMTITLMSVPVVALANTELVNGIEWEFRVSGGKATIVNNSSVGSAAISTATTGAVEVPSLLGGYPVTQFGFCAFYGCSGMTSVTIPESVTKMDRAFLGCTGLKSVTVASGNPAYSSRDGVLFDKTQTELICCPGGKVGAMTIPKGVTSISWYAFYDCSELTSVTMPESVTYVGDEAFVGCSGLKSVTIAPPVKKLSTTFPDAYNKIEKVVLCEGVTSIGEMAFEDCVGLKSVTMPEGVTSIGWAAFRNCRELKSVSIPLSVTSIGYQAFDGCELMKVEYFGPPPSGAHYGQGVFFPREYGAEWMKKTGVVNMFAGFVQSKKPVVEVVSAAIRESDPAVIDVVYKVTSEKPTVKVRALAFKDGKRSFDTVVRPTEFIEDTAKNIGDAIAANTEHKLSWRVSADWQIDLANVKFELLVLEGDLLPLELIMIPKVGDHAGMEISWNVISDQQVFDALLWLYADATEGLTCENGVLKDGSTELVIGTDFRISTRLPGGGSMSSTLNAPRYVFSKMGYSLFCGDNEEDRNYAESITRMQLGLGGGGWRGYRFIESPDDND